MKETIKNKWQGINELMGRLAAQKKKTTLAACLVIVMIFMWVKVLAPSGPDSAAAAVVGDEAPEPQSKMTYVELPVVEGRNDMLTRDFFTIDEGFLRGGGGVDVIADGGSEGLTKRIVEKLKLGAIVSGENPQAFINDELVSEGDKLVVEERDNEYEFTVVKIRQNTVFLRCGEMEITLKLALAIEGTD